MSLSVSFDGIALESFNDYNATVKLLEYSIRPLPSLKSPGINMPGADGLFEIKKVYNASTISITVMLHSFVGVDKIHDIKRKLLTWLTMQNSIKVVFSDDEDVYRNAFLSDTEDEKFKIISGQMGYTALLTLTMTMADPFVYAKQPTIYNISTIGESFEVINDSLPTPYIIYVSEQMLSEDLIQQAIGLGNAGVVNADVGSFAIANSVGIAINDDVMRFSNLSKDDILTIDSNDFSVMVNGVNAVSRWDGDMGDLQHGTNFITVDNLHSSYMNVLIKFNRRWV